MPQTVNGIGTHYYGERNVNVRQGVCRRCHAQAALKSYDTRLFVVVLFIPVFPLGRKRIIDACPHCTGHYALPARQWEVSGQLNLSDAQTRFANEPTGESAARGHSQLLSYFQYEEAAELRNQALARLPNDAGLRADLAWQMRACEQHAEALQLFDDALRLRPDLPSARLGKAPYLIGQGKLDEAREMLDFLMAPGAAQMYDLEPLLVLFAQLVAGKRPDDALALVPHLLQELPHLKDDFWFRKTVGEAETALGHRDSLLPERNRSLASLLFSNSRDYSPRARRLARWSIAAAIVLAALALHNESVRRQRTIYVINNTGVPAQVRVGQQPPVAINPGAINQRTPITLGEGEHEIQISGPLESTEKLVVESGYFARWFKRPVWLVNINGQAVVLQVDIVYSAIHAPSTPHVHVGQTLLAFDDVDYLFDEEPPKQISVKGQQTVTKSQVQVLEMTPHMILAQLADNNLPGVLSMAENSLKLQPDADFLEAYCDAAKRHGHRERAAKFLESRLDRRPIDVAWHRQYQNLLDTEATAPAVLASYEKLTHSEPESGAAWYLFARQDPDIARAERSLAKALELDPKLGWGLYFLASLALNRAEWEQAEQYFTEALAAPAPDQAWRIIKIYSLLAQQKFDAVDAECDALDAASDSHGTIATIALVRFWSKHLRHMPVDIAAATAQATRKVPADQVQLVRVHLEAFLNYAAGNWDALRANHQNPLLATLSPQDKSLQLISTLSADALKTSFPPTAVITEAADGLAIGLAFALTDDPAAAAPWRQKAIDLFRQGSHSDRRFAAAIAGENPPVIADLRDIHVSPHIRALACACLAQQFPDQREQFLAEARLWQLLPLKHYWIVDLALQKLAEHQP